MHHWIDASNALADFLDRHATQTTAFLDTEFMRVDTFYPRLALLQVSFDGDIALVDPLTLGGIGGLAGRIAAPQTLAVMHSASEDLEALAAFLPGGLGRLFDTQIAAALSGFGLGLSYQKLVAAVTGIELPKAETRSDWLRRPLSAEQLEYAAQDVEHLPAVHAELVGRLDRLGRRAWHAEDCARLVERARRREGEAEPQRAFRSAAEWPREKQALLRRLLRWREATARREDRPRTWLLDDAHAAEFCLQPPQDAEEIYQRGKGLRALRGPLRNELLAEIRRPLDAGELDFAAIPPLPGPAEKRILAAMRDAVAKLAAQLDLPEGLLCARRHLETLIADRTWPESLEGWRRPLLHEALMRCLP